MNVRRLLTVAQLAIHFGRSISEVEDVLNEAPAIKPVARADSCLCVRWRSADADSVSTRTVVILRRKGATYE